MHGGVPVSQTAGRGADHVPAMLWALPFVECHSGPSLWLPSAIVHQENGDVEQFQPTEILLWTWQKMVLAVSSNCSLPNEKRSIKTLLRSLLLECYCKIS